MASSLPTNLNDPLNYLPYEVWVECLHLAISDEPTGPLSLLEVSSNWMKKITTSPELWSRIYIDNGEDQLARAETFLTLSEPVRIDLVVEASDELQLKLFKDIINRYALRIQGLYFSRVFITHFARIIQMTSMESTTPIFPNVTHIDVMEDMNLWELVFIQVFPKIQMFPPVLWDQDELELLPKTLERAFVRVDNEAKIKWPVVDYSLYNLQDIDISSENMRTRFSNGDLLRATCIECKRLKVACDGFIPCSCCSSRSKSSSICTYPPNGGRRRVPLRYYYFFPPLRVRSLVLRGTYISSTLKAFTMSPQHYLQKLELHMSWYQLTMITPHLSSWISLHSLSLTLLCGPEFDDWESPHIYKEDLRQLDHFNLTLIEYRRRKGTTSAAARIVRVFTENSPLRVVQRVEFHPTEISADVTHAFLRSLESVKSLNLGMCSGRASEPALLPNLLYLTVKNWEALLFIEAPSLLHLETTFVGLSESSQLPAFPSLRSLLIYAPHFLAPGRHFPRLTTWSNLRVIRWTPSEVDSIPTFRYIPSLVELFFDQPSTITGNRRLVSYMAQNALNIFLQDLICYPETCPQLSVIKSAYYPSWSLMGSLIRLRSANPNVAPIHTLQLPTYPQVAILRTLVGCLGSTTRLPSSERNAFDGIDAMLRNRINDESMFSGVCFACLGSGYVTCHGKSANRPSEEEREIIHSIVRENLEQQSHRAAETASLEALRGLGLKDITVTDPVKNRLWACSRHSVIKLTHITAHTLFGRTFEES